jgi:hypothetical protein
LLLANASLYRAHSGLSPPSYRPMLGAPRKDYRHTADSQILKHSLANHYLESIGFPNVLERFEILQERIGWLLKIRDLTATH